MTPSELTALAFTAFEVDAATAPATSLRAGDQLDDYEEPGPYDPDIDKVSDAYLEAFPWGISHLDPASWRHYLPHLIDYVVRHCGQGTHVGEATISSLRPPDRDPPRLASLTPAQETAVTLFLEFLAFSDESAHQGTACQAIDEWWSPAAMYRPTPL